MCEVGLPVRGWQVGFCTFLGEGQHMFPGLEDLIKKVGWFFRLIDVAAIGLFTCKSGMVFSLNAASKAQNSCKKVGWFFGLCRRARSGVVKKWHDFFVKDVSGRRTYVRFQTSSFFN